MSILIQRLLLLKLKIFDNVGINQLRNIVVRKMLLNVLQLKISFYDLVWDGFAKSTQP